MIKTIPFLLLICSIFLACKKENNPEDGINTVPGDQSSVSYQMPEPNEINLKGINRILILGNSITEHVPYPSIGWYQNCGMAASSIENDYVHLLISKVRKVNPWMEVKYGPIGDFETNFWNYDTSFFEEHIRFRADLIILRMGENVDDAKAYPLGFRNKIIDLVERLRKDRNVMVCLTNSFWPNNYVNTEILESCKKGKYIFVDISDLYADRTNSAEGHFENVFVAAHPSDKGMKNIAGRIWYYIASMDYPVPVSVNQSLTTDKPDE